MFGEAALSAPSLKRNATIMTVSDCHFGCLNRKIYQQHVQKATETNKKNTVNYICNTGIFNGFPKELLNKKFFSVFVFKKNKKNDLIIRQKEINNNIILIKEGIYEIIFTGNMHDIYNLINIYYKKLLNLIDIKNEEQDEDEELNSKIAKIKDQKYKIEKILGSEMYKNEEYKILLIDSPSTFGLREVEEKIKKQDKVGNISFQYMSYYDVKCNSLKGEYKLIDKNVFYKQIYSTEYTVQETTKIISRQFIQKIINRLLNIRLSKIYNILISKGSDKNKYYLTQDNKSNSEGNHHNLNISHNSDFYKRINLLIDQCDENKFAANNFEEYVFNYFENKKEQNLKEKREFKNRKEKFKQNAIEKDLLKDHSCFSYANTNANLNQKYTFSRVASAINTRSKLSFGLYRDKDKDKDKYHLTKNEKFLLIPLLKNKRSSKKFLNFKQKKFPKSIKTKSHNYQNNNIFHKNKKEINVDSILAYNIKPKKLDFFFPENLEKNEFFPHKFKICENEDYKNNTNNYYINQKFNKKSGTNLITIPKMILNKSKSVYEIKKQNKLNFIKNRSNYVINITRSFFTKNKDFDRKIRLKSS